MSFIEDVEAETILRVRCPIETLEDEHRDAIDNHPEYSAAAIARALLRNNIEGVTHQAISRHRRRDCKCRPLIPGE